MLFGAPLKKENIVKPVENSVKEEEERKVDSKKAVETKVVEKKAELPQTNDEPTKRLSMAQLTNKTKPKKFEAKPSQQEEEEKALGQQRLKPSIFDADDDSDDDEIGPAVKVSQPVVNKKKNLFESDDDDEDDDDMIAIPKKRITHDEVNDMDDFAVKQSESQGQRKQTVQPQGANSYKNKLEEMLMKGRPQAEPKRSITSNHANDDTESNKKYSMNMLIKEENPEKRQRRVAEYKQNLGDEFMDKPEMVQKRKGKTVKKVFFDEDDE